MTLYWVLIDKINYMKHVKVECEEITQKVGFFKRIKLVIVKSITIGSQKIGLSTKKGSEILEKEISKLVSDLESASNAQCVAEKALRTYSDVYDNKSMDAKARQNLLNSFMTDAKIAKLFTSGNFTASDSKEFDKVKKRLHGNHRYAFLKLVLIDKDNMTFNMK